MLRQASCSGTVPGHHGMWSAQELDEEWLACATGAAGEEWPQWRPGPFGTYRWEKKKSELTEDEKAAWERLQAKDAATAKAKQE